MSAVKDKPELTEASVQAEQQRVDRDLSAAREHYQRAAHAYVLDKNAKTKASMDAAKATLDGLEGEQVGLQAALTHAREQSDDAYLRSRLDAAAQDAKDTLDALDAVPPAYEKALDALIPFAQAWRGFQHAVAVARHLEINLAADTIGNGNLPAPRMNFEDFLEALLFAAFGPLHCERTDLVMDSSGKLELGNPGALIRSAVHRARADAIERTKKRLQQIRDHAEQQQDDTDDE
jgi:hypothetical protein